MKQSGIFILLYIIIATSFPRLSTSQPLSGTTYQSQVLPGVSGFGLETKGGKGGEIVKVSNLNKEGPGSLREAIQTSGPRIIVFEVGGVIDLERESLDIAYPFITIAGQTAPFPGITLIKGGIKIKTHDVIIQHLKVRPGEAGQAKKSGWEVDGIATSGGAHHVIVDHCSVTWATDENLSASGPRFGGNNLDEWRANTSHQVVFSHCLIAEGLSESTHAKGEHSKGSLIHDNATAILIIGNLFASNHRRNPYCKGGTQVAIINNFVYNPGGSAIRYNLLESEWEGHEWVTGKIVGIGNSIQFGKDTKRTVTAGNFQNGPVEVFWKDNLVNSNPKKKNITGTFTFLDQAPFWPEGLTIIPADEVRDWVLQNAGAVPWQRDEIDQRIINEVRSGEGRIIDSETEVGGYPQFEPQYRVFDADQWDLNTMTQKE